MKKIVIAFILLITFSNISNSQPIVFDWSSSFAGKPGIDGILGMAKDAQGNLYISGEFTGTKSFGIYTLIATGYSELYVAKFNSTGACQWAIKGGANFSTAYAGKLTVTGNDVYVTGYFTNILNIGGTLIGSAGAKDIFIASLDATNGACNWLYSAGGTDEDYGVNLYPALGGGFFLCGTFTGSATFGTHNVSTSSIIDADLFVAKYEANGTCTWVRNIGTLGNETATCIKQLPGGGLLLTGGFEGTVQFGPGITLNSPISTDIFLAKLDGLGNTQWAVSAGGENTDIANSLSFDPAGNIYVTGFIGDTATFGSITINNGQNNNAFIAKFSGTGVCEWVRMGGAISDDAGIDIVTDAGGSSYMVGYVNPNCNFGSTILTGVMSNDAFVAKYNTTGDLRWVARIGGLSIDRGKAILLDVNGFVIVAGDFEGTMTIGNNPPMNAAAASWSQFITRMGGGTVDVSEIADAPFSVYPNPVTHMLHFDLQKITDEIFTIDLFDIDGKRISTRELNRQSAAAGYSMPCGSLPAGNYLVKVNTSQGDFVRRIVVTP